MLFLVIVILATSLFAAQAPYLGTPYAIPGVIQAENYDTGGEGVAWHDTSAGNVFGVYRTDDMDVGRDTAGAYFVGFLANGEWAEYTVNVATTRQYDIRLRVASAYAGPNNFHIELDGVNVTGTQSIASTGDWNTYTIKTIQATLTAGSNRVLRVSFDTGAWNLDYLDIAASACTAPAITQQPVSKTPDPSTSITLTASASGNPIPTYQWLKNGIAINGATSSSLTLSNVEQGKDAGNYSLRATNSCGTATSAAAVVRVTCGGSPDWQLENVNRALRGQGDYCDWTEDFSSNFPYNFGNGQGYNRPVEAAAVALIKDPNHSGVNMSQWWTDYLSGELGDRGTVWFYGGQELGSYIYQRYNEATILAVYYYANATNQTGISTLARRWLRATIALHALTASPGPLLTEHANGQMRTPTVSYNGPYIAMAGMRSAWGFWAAVDRSILMAQALGVGTNRSGELGPQSSIRTYVETHWTNQTENAYGLNSTDRGDLWNAVASGTQPTNFVSRFLGTNLRTQVRYHIVAWPGVKVTLMERNTHTSTAPTYGVAYFTAPRLASGNEAHFLYPWQDLFIDGDRRDRQGITQ